MKGDCIPSKYDYDVKYSKKYLKDKVCMVQHSLTSYNKHENWSSCA